ncbi:hypothetical protein ACLMJK_002354 [Lecanora helva]
MAPQLFIPVSANVLGTIGTIFWCVQLVPQVVRNYRTKSTEGLPAAMMFLWSISGVPFGVYAIVQNFNIPIQIQPQFFCALCLMSWAQCLRYQHKWRIWTTTLLASVLAIVFAGIELLLVFIIRRPYRRGLSWPVTFIGVLAAVLLIVGYVPIPSELWKRRGRVVGIDFGFLTIDWFGAFFSLMALVAQHTFDILGGVMYAACAAIEAMIFLSQGIWLLRTRKIRQRAKEAEMTWEEFPEAQAWQEKRWRLSWSRDRIQARKADKPSKGIVDEESVYGMKELGDIEQPKEAINRHGKGCD